MQAHDSFVITLITHITAKTVAVSKETILENILSFTSWKMKSFILWCCLRLYIKINNDVLNDRRGYLSNIIHNFIVFTVF